MDFMKGLLRNFVMLIAIAILAACSPSPSQESIETAIPTATDYPTYTPYPTFTEGPTQTPRIVIATITHTPSITPTLTVSPTPSKTPIPTIDTTGYSVNQVLNVINRNYIMVPGPDLGWDKTFTWEGLDLNGTVSYNVNSNNRVDAIQSFIKFPLEVSDSELNTGTHILNFPFYLTGDDQLDAFVDSCITNNQPRTKIINGNNVEVIINYKQIGVIKIGVRVNFN